MKRFKLLIFFTVLLAALILTACESKGTPSNSGPDGGEADGQEQAAGRYTADGRRIITIGTWYDRYYVSKHTDISDDPQLSAPETAAMRLETVREIEEKYNIVLEYINLTYDGIRESIAASALAKKPEVDIYEVDMQFGIPAVLGGQAVSLEEMGLAGTDVFEAKTVMEYLKVTGQAETYLFAPANNGAVSAYVLAYNKDMIKAAGLADPQDLYDRGEWTWTEWRKQLLALTKDTTGDGVTDIYGYGGYWTNLVSNLLMSNGTGIATSDRETLSSKGTVEVLDFIYAMYNTDKVARPWDNSNWNINNELYASGLSGFWIGADWLFGEQGGADLPFEIGVVPWPCGPSGNAATNKHSKPQSNWYFIPDGVENPRLVYDVIYDWVNWYDGDLEVGVDVEWSKNMYMTSRNFAYATFMDSKPGIDLWDSIGVDADFAAILRGEITPAEFVAANSELYQTAIDAYMSK